jgi:hypothetical protein
MRCALPGRAGPAACLERRLEPAVSAGPALRFPMSSSVPAAISGKPQLFTRVSALIHAVLLARSRPSSCESCWNSEAGCGFVAGGGTDVSSMSTNAHQLRSCRLRALPAPPVGDECDTAPKYRRAIRDVIRLSRIVVSFRAPIDGDGNEAHRPGARGADCTANLVRLDPARCDGGEHDRERSSGRFRAARAAGDTR